MKYTKKIQLITSPLIEHYLGKIRDEKTKSKDFKIAMNKLTTNLLGASNLDLKLNNKKIKTPVAGTVISELSEEIILLPILRAGLAMSPVFEEMIPDASTGHIGCYRKKDLSVKNYYFSLPEIKNHDNAHILLLDPMLATANTATMAITEIRKKTSAKITAFFLIASEDGIKKIRKEFPEIQVYVAAIDPILTTSKYINPGLGDAGDRYFGTE